MPATFRSRAIEPGLSTDPAASVERSASKRLQWQVCGRCRDVTFALLTATAVEKAHQSENSRRTSPTRRAGCPTGIMDFADLPGELARVWRKGGNGIGDD